MSQSSSPRVGTRPAVRGVAAALIASSLALGVSACGTGQGWVEQGRDPWGNGQFITVGALQGQSLTLVQGPEGSKSATLVGTFFNPSAEPDALVGATIDGTAAVIPGGTVPIPPGNVPVRVGYNSTHFVNFSPVEAKPATYVPVTLKFEKSGETAVRLLVVPPAGYYEGIAPSPPAA